MRWPALSLALGGVVVSIACGSSGDSEFIDGDGDGKRDAGSGPTNIFPTSDAEADTGPVEPATDVEAVVTTDNAFSFGYGNDSGLSTFIRGEGSDGAGIFDCPVGFGPTKYIVPAAQAPVGAYLYIIAWADNAVTQGTLAQFKRVGGTPVYSGDGAWQVCAIGTPYDDKGPGPDQATVNASIAQCNLGATGSTYSKGWVTTAGAVTPGAIGKLAFGEANDDPGGDFPIVCQVDDAGVQGIDAVAKWMWFDPEDGSSPFVGNDNNRTKTFLLFRLAAADIPAVIR
jgi:hypothetical protein